VAYFFCSRNTGEGQLSDPTEVLSSVLKQLLCSLPGKQQLESCVANDYYERRARAEADASDVDRLDAREITDHIIQLTREISATIFIDALDECDPSRRHWLTTWLDQLLLKAINPVKVMISSREDTSIVLKLQKSPNIYISVKDNAPDIRRFVMAEVQQAIDLGRLLNGRVDESLQRQIIGMLVVKSNGMHVTLISL
jgi:hypothetical protein